MRRFALAITVLSLLFVFPHLYGRSATNQPLAQGSGGCIGAIPEEEQAPPDADGDGILDIEDNCPNEYNPSQTDVEGQLGVGDLCERLTPEANEPESPGVATCFNDVWETDLGEECEFVPDGNGGLTQVGCSNGDECEACVCVNNNVSLCGNLILDNDEACDLVMTDQGLQPAGLCDFENGEVCSSTCACVPGETNAECGNFTWETGEDCDFINGRNGTIPVGNCDFAGGQICSNCECISVVCGDGIIAGNETCDFITGPRGTTPILDRCQEGQTCDPTTCQCSGGSVDTCGDGVITGAEVCEYLITDQGPVPILDNCAPGDSCGEPDTPEQCQCIGASQDFCDEIQCPGVCESIGSITFCNDNACGGPGINCDSDPGVCDALEPEVGLPMICDATCCVPEFSD